MKLILVMVVGLFITSQCFAETKKVGSFNKTTTGQALDKKKFPYECRAIFSGLKNIEANPAGYDGFGVKTLDDQLKERGEYEPLNNAFNTWVAEGKVSSHRVYFYQESKVINVFYLPTAEAGDQFFALPELRNVGALVKNQGGTISTACRKS